MQDSTGYTSPLRTTRVGRHILARFQILQDGAHIQIHVCLELDK